MLTPIIVLLSSFLNSLYTFGEKLLLKKRLNPYLIVWSITFGAVFFGIALSFVSIPVLTTTFWIVCILSAISWIIADVLFIKALKLTDLSIISPLYAFRILVTGVVAWILLKELPSFIGLLGVITMIIGSYFVEYSSNHKKFESFKKFFFTKSALLVFITFPLYAINATLDKIGVLESNFFVYGVLNHIIAMSLFTIILSKLLLKNKNKIKANKKFLFIMGMLNISAALLAMYLYNFMEVVYVSALGNVSIIFSVLLAGIFLREKNFKNRIIAAVLIFIGATFIIIG